MIKINLLPQELAGAKAAGPSFQAGGSLLIALVAIVLLVVNVGLGGYMYFQYSDAMAERNRLQREADAIEEELAETEVQYEEMKTSIERMERLISVAEALDPPDRILWARKLNMLPLLVPEGVYLTEIEVTRNVRLVETDAYLDARNRWEREREGPPPEVEREPVISQTLVLQGVAYVDGGTPNQRLEQLIRFSDNLRGDSVRVPFDREPAFFMEGFTGGIRPSPVSGARIEGREVSRFSFTMNTQARRIR